MLQLESMAAVPAGSWGEDGGGMGSRSGDQWLRHPASQLGCCRDGGGWACSQY